MQKLFKRGVFLEQNKEPALSRDIKVMGLPSKVYLPVRKGDIYSKGTYLKKYQLISKEEGTLLVNSFCSIDGIVEDRVSFDCEKYKDNDFLLVTPTTQQTKSVSSSSAPSFSAKQIIELSANYGILDSTDKLPLHQKLSRYVGGVANLVINAVDDEPYVSGQLGQLLFRTEETQRAISLLEAAVKPSHTSIVIYGKSGPLDVKLPKTIGAYRVEKINGPYPVSKMLRCDKETLYVGMGALLSLYYSVTQSQPCVTTVVTVAGDCIANPYNVEVAIGTPIGDVLKFCGLNKNPDTVILGGSMTGYLIEDMNIPVLKTTKAILAFKGHRNVQSYPCIGCGHCIDVCPKKLLPYYIYRYYLVHNTEKLRKLKAQECIECGACSYMCPAKIDIRQFVKNSRRHIKKEGESR